MTNVPLAEMLRYNKWANRQARHGPRSGSAVPGQVYRYPVSFFLVHAMTHGVEHRTEIKLTLAQLGVATPDLDGRPYSAASGYGREV